MYKFICVLFSIIVIGISCKNKQENKPSVNNTQSDSTTSFPIMELFREDANDAEKTPYFKYKITTQAGQKKRLDSVALTIDDFSKIIAPLMKIDVSSKTEKGKYKEIAFHDLSTKSYSVITTAIEKNTELKSMTALLNDETNKLKSIYFVTEKESADTAYRITYFWKVNKSLRIVRSIQVKGQLKETIEFINWNDTENQ